ncbi:Fic family protein [Arachnia propionica]|uniref:Fic family protein n=1 Tax=Arachnia propionica TaxID=1750 RepID=UPI001C8BC419|nr:Fic family protein [Arachnia propionica]
MARWASQQWQSMVEGMPRRDRMSGPYRAYVPDLLRARPLVLSAELDARIARTEREVHALQLGQHAADVTGLSHFLLRSEAIASSYIEGVTPAARRVAEAELELAEGRPASNQSAGAVARNATIVKQAISRLAMAEAIARADIVELQSALLAEQPDLQGVRHTQNWVGGSKYHPLTAAFVPPPPAEVPALLDDLAAYLSGAAHGMLVQAALAHAQFETIHPFPDGNGRVGRALIHTVFARRTPGGASVLPVSLILATFSQRYEAALTAYRYDGAPTSQAATAGVQAWLEFFCDTVMAACSEVRRLGEEMAQVRAEWDDRLAAHRAAADRKRALRADSAEARVLAGLPGTPVLTIATAQQLYDISDKSAASALRELTAAGILTETGRQRGRSWFAAADVLDLVTVTERRLASTRFDTVASAPHRPVPARPSP